MESVRTAPSIEAVSAKPGDPNPKGGMSQFGGSGVTSFASPDLGMPFREWHKRMSAQRPEVDAAAQAILRARYDLRCTPDESAAMSRGKALSAGPVARLAPA